MLAIEEWGAGRFEPMVMLAQMVAVGSAACHQTILESRASWIMQGNQRIANDPDRWLRLYREPLRLEATLHQLSFAPHQVESFAHNIAAPLMTSCSWADSFSAAVCELMTGQVSSPDAMNSQQKIRDYYQSVHLPLMRNLLTGSTELPTYAQAWLELPELVFVMKVATPCWFEFQQTPHELYVRACHGDWKALDCLLRLDPEVDKDSALRAVVGRHRVTHPKQYRHLNKARWEGRKKTITLVQVKFLLGGLLMKWSSDFEKILNGQFIFDVLRQLATEQNRAAVEKLIEAQSQPLECPAQRCALNAGDIKRLFDAVVKDTGQGLVDDDFDQQPNSIYKRLDRNADLWRSLLDTDKNRAA